ncbi:hypothetical protein C823_006488 [Eubacterium plexicaudatum ASF492]|nr:hypothetical protein C823_006488 [Eubacterium plexicaudatum ASF492]
MFENIPKVKVGIVAVSRDCFPESLSVNRRKALVEAYRAKYDEADIYECPICIVESEIHMQQALEDVKKAGCNALVVYLGNFGPEISETLLAKHFEGPKMFVAAAEESGDSLIGGRGDAYCGMLNASYNLKLRNVRVHIPEYPVGTALECADMIHEFLPVARAVIGLGGLKIISFGPRPMNFLPAMHRLSSCITWVLKLKKTRSWIYLKHFINTKTMHGYRKWLPIWKKSWVQETKNRRFCQSWHIRTDAAGLDRRA